MGNRPSSPDFDLEECDLNVLAPPLKETDCESKFEWSLEVRGHTLDMRLATPERFRLIDADALVNDDVLRIQGCQSSHTIGSVKYIAISYPWKGNHRAPFHNSFAVKGAEDGDRIAVDVLLTLCRASLQNCARYIWLDRLCMMQSSKLDKHWQIRKMARIYEKCTACFVLPGGLGRMVGLYENTSWIYRSWTLQEAMLPDQVVCLFTWHHGNGEFENFEDGLVTMLDSSTASSRLTTVLGICSGPLREWEFTQLESRKPVYLTDPELFSKEKEPILALAAAMEAKKMQHEASEHTAIWRCAIMRTSTREEDVVYSMMGLFDVNLDPSQYTNQRDTLIGLCKEILRRGGKAFWLGASVSAPSSLSSKLCTMPDLPKPTNEGPPVNRNSVEGYTMLKGIYVYLDDAPTGTMDDNGVLEFTARMSAVEIVSIQSTPPWPEEGVPDEFGNDYALPGFSAIAKILANNRVERLHGFAGKAGTHAVEVGRQRPYSHLFSDEAVDYPITLMLLNRGKDGVWCKTGMAVVEAAFLSTWNRKMVRV